MTSTPEHMYRDAYRRQHRLLGCYLALDAWMRCIDCVVLSRDQLLPFLGLKHMQNKRITWLKNDVRDFFPHHFVTVTSSAGAYATLYLARLPIPEHDHRKKMSDVDRASLFTSTGLKSALVSIPDEEDMVAMLAQRMCGLRV